MQSKHINHVERHSFRTNQIHNDSYENTKKDLPINIKFCLEAMEESGSVMLEETVRSRTDFFATEVDWVCISDNYFLGKTKPCLTYGYGFDQELTDSKTF